MHVLHVQVAHLQQEVVILVYTQVESEPLGTTEDTFQVLDVFPVEMELLNKSAILYAILRAVDYNILAEILSQPLPFLVSRDSNISRTSSSVHRNSSGHRSGLVLSNIEMLLSVSGETD